MANRAFTMVMASFAADSLALGAHSGAGDLPGEWVSHLNRKQCITELLQKLR